ncbi:MAG TPA: glycosyltransferase [Cyclobacteriaceae bacterium]|nr:glycosyltransferase [Cyclobacteriaceae bacterium]
MLIYILLSLSAVHVVYFLVLWQASNRIKSTFPNKDLPVSVIVCARNELKNLKELIPQLLGQEHSKFELIVVDDRSDDGSYDYLLELSKQNQQLKWLRVDHLPGHVNSKKYAITLGVKASSHEVLLFTDADCRPVSENWISHMVSAFAEEQISFVLGISPYEKRAGVLNAFIRYEAWLTAMFYTGMAAFGRPYMGVGRNMAYRKKVFMENGGFEKHIAVAGGDDDLLVNRLANKKNTAVCVHPEALIYSIPKKKWSSFLKQKLRHLHAGKYYSTADKLILSVYNFSFFLYWPALCWMFMSMNDLLIPLVIMLGRLLLLMVAAGSNAKRLGHSLNIWMLPLLDFLYLFYYLSTGARALSKKRVSWS